MKISEYVHLHPTGMDATDMENAEHEKAKKSWLCGGCMRPRPSTLAINLRIDSDPMPRPISFVAATGVMLIQTDFLELFDPNLVKRDLYIGKLLNSVGKNIDGWVTVRGRQQVIIRGSKNVSYRRCDSCGEVGYFAMGQRYLFPAPPEGASIYQSDLCGLVMPSSFVEGLQLKKWRKLGVEKLKVLHEAKDGLGELAD